jgi:CheY-like chemotaxis protein
MGGKVSLCAVEHQEGQGVGTLFKAILPVTLDSPKPAKVEMVKFILGEVVLRRLSLPDPDNLDDTGLNQTLQSLNLHGQVGPDAQTGQVAASDQIVSSNTPIDPPVLLRDPLFTTKPPIRILVVDDNELGRRILLTLLDRLSRNTNSGSSLPVNSIVREAIDGIEALQVFEQFQPQLVLTDVSMPNMDGVTAAREMRAIERRDTWQGERSVIYAITGLGSSDPRLRMDALGGGAELDGWLIKGKDSLSRVGEIVRDVADSL